MLWTEYCECAIYSVSLNCHDNTYHCLNDWNAQNREKSFYQKLNFSSKLNFIFLVVPAQFIITSNSKLTAIFLKKIKFKCNLQYSKKPKHYNWMLRSSIPKSMEFLQKCKFCSFPWLPGFTTHGWRRAFLLRCIHGARAVFPSSGYGFCPWQVWCTGLHRSKLPLGLVNAGIPRNPRNWNIFSKL